MKKLFSIALVVALVVGLKVFNKGRDGDTIRAEAYELMTSLPDYSAHASFFEEAFPRAHKAAFEEAYSMGGRRKGASLDESAYLSVLFSSLARQARAGGEPDLAASVEAYLALVQATVAE